MGAGGSVARSLFDRLARRYDEWYIRHRDLYRAELEAVAALGCAGGVEVGVGSGRFAGPLGLRAGVDVSRGMLKLAPRELDLVEAAAEALPLRRGAYPCALFVVTLCFLQDPAKALVEAAEVVERVVACIVPRGSPWGVYYMAQAAAGHPFYSHAKFYTVAEVVEMAKAAGLTPARAVAVLEGGPPGGYERPRSVSLEEAERYGFACVEFIKRSREGPHEGGGRH